MVTRWKMKRGIVERERGAQAIEVNQPQRTRTGICKAGKKKRPFVLTFYDVCENEKWTTFESEEEEPGLILTGTISGEERGGGTNTKGRTWTDARTEKEKEKRKRKEKVQSGDSLPRATLDATVCLHC